MAIPIYPDLLLPQIQNKRCCPQDLRQKYGDEQNQCFLLMLGRLLLSPGAADSSQAAMTESLVLSLLRQMHHDGYGGTDSGTLQIPYRAPCQTLPKSSDSSPESSDEPKASKNCLHTTEESANDHRSNLNYLIQKASAAYNVDAKLVSAVIRAESNFDPDAASPKGAKGLMQLMPETAKELGVEDPYDPEENIKGGVRYLKNLLDRYAGNVHDALAAYNWGMGNLERNPGMLPKETRSYIAQVLKYYEDVEA